MARRTLTDDVPALPAVAPTPRADWSDWSQTYERQRLENDIRIRQQAAETAIYPREIAAKMADDAARQCVPDWRLVREEQTALFSKLLRLQPELQQREVKQLDNVLRLVSDNLPRHLQTLLSDLRIILALQQRAHETAAFLVGCETGRRLERQYVDAKGRLCGRARAPRGESQAALRLHAADDE